MKFNMPAYSVLSNKNMIIINSKIEILSHLLFSLFYLYIIFWQII